MAEERKVSGKMQLNTEGGLLRASATSEMVDGSGAKSGLGNGEAAGGFIGESGITEAGLGNGDAAGSSTGEIGAGGSTGKTNIVNIIKAWLANKGAAGCSTGEVGVTQAEQREVAGIGKVMAASWIDYFAYLPDKERLKQELKAEPMDPMVSKERVPASVIGILVKRRPLKKYPPITDSYTAVISKRDPDLLPLVQELTSTTNCCVDLHYDILRQHAEKGFAEVGVDFTGGEKKVFVLP